MFEITVKLTASERLLAVLERIAGALEAGRGGVAPKAAIAPIAPIAPLEVPPDDGVVAEVPEVPARKPKRAMSAEGLANIRAAAARRWAKVRGEVAAEVVPPAVVTPPALCVPPVSAPAKGPIVVPFENVLRWAGERGIEFRNWDALPAVNKKRRELGLPEFGRVV